MYGRLALRRLAHTCKRACCYPPLDRLLTSTINLVASNQKEAHKRLKMTFFSETTFPANSTISQDSDAGLEKAIDFSSAKDHFQQLQTPNSDRLTVNDGHVALQRMNVNGEQVHKPVSSGSKSKKKQERQQPNTQDSPLPHARTANPPPSSQKGDAKPTASRSKQLEAQAQMAATQLSKDQVDAHDEEITLQKTIEKNLDIGLAAFRSEKQAYLQKVFDDRIRCQEWISNGSAASAKPVDLKTAIGRQVNGFWKTSRPTASMSTQRQRVISAIQDAIDRRWPGQGLKIAAFGSSVTGLVTDTSDLDLVLLDPTRPHGVGTPEHLTKPAAERVPYYNNLPNWYRVYSIADAIRSTNLFTEVVAISGANVPIVKMIHKASKLPADLNINERFGLFNSRLISAYADLQPEIVRPLTFFLKHWFLARGMNDPSGKSGAMSFSSYSIALMVIQFLQVQGMLPNLQDARLIESLSIPRAYLWSRPRQTGYRQNAPSTIIPPQRYDVTFATTSGIDHRQMVIDVTPHHEEQSIDDLFARKLGDLLMGFFHYYAKFDFRQQVISISSGAPVELQTPGFDPDFGLLADSDDDSLHEELEGLQLDVSPREASKVKGSANDWINPAMADYVQPAEWCKDEIVIQDPLITNRNTAKNVKGMVMHQFHAEIYRAELLLERSGSTSSEFSLISNLLIPTTIVPHVDYRDAAIEAAARSVSDTPTGPKDEEAVRDLEAEQQIEEEVKRRTIRNWKKNEKTRLRRKAKRLETAKTKAPRSKSPPPPPPPTSSKGPTEGAHKKKARRSSNASTSSSVTSAKTKSSTPAAAAAAAAAPAGKKMVKKEEEVGTTARTTKKKARRPSTTSISSSVSQQPKDARTKEVHASPSWMPESASSEFTFSVPSDGVLPS